METFFALLAICAGYSPATGEFPTQRPVTRFFMFYLICAWINGWINNGEAGDLRRYRAHYDVTLMVGQAWYPYYYKTKINKLLNLGVPWNLGRFLCPFSNKWHMMKKNPRSRITTENLSKFSIVVAAGLAPIGINICRRSHPWLSNSNSNSKWFTQYKNISYIYRMSRQWIQWNKCGVSLIDSHY